MTPRWADAGDLDRTHVVGGPVEFAVDFVSLVVVAFVVVFEVDDEVLTERRLDHLAPFDEHDAVELRQFGQGQVRHFLGAVEPVEIGMVQGHPSERSRLRHVVAVHQRVRR